MSEIQLDKIEKQQDIDEVSLEPPIKAEASKKEVHKNPKQPLEMKALFEVEADTEIVERLKIAGERSTFHFMPSMVMQDRKSFKIIWIIMSVISIGVCLRTLVINVSDFLNYKVETVVGIIQESGVEFPTVTFCNLHICADGYSVDAYLNNYTKTYFNKSQYSELTADEKKQINVFKVLSATQNAYLTDPQNKNKLKSLFNPFTNQTLKSNLINCQYSSESCHVEDFVFYEISELHKCFKFNSGPLVRKAKRYGKTYGLQLELFLDMPNICKSPWNVAGGMAVYIHNSSYNVTEEFNGIELEPGAETNIAIDRTVYSKQPKPYSACIQTNQQLDSDASRFAIQTVEKFTKYNQVTCMQLCYQNYLLNKFNCYDRLLPYYNNSVPNCESIIVNSSNIKYYDKISFYDESQDTKCLEYCPLECEYVVYKSTVSSSLYPTQTYQEVLIKNENISGQFETDQSYEIVKKSILAFNIYFKTDFSTKITEKPSITQDVFVSNIGGTVSLFLGIGLLSLIELLEFLYELLLFSCSKKKPAK